MPRLRLLRSLALIVPILAIIVVIGNYVPALSNFNADLIRVVSSSPLFSWPLATHPDERNTNLDTQSEDAGDVQKPLHANVHGYTGHSSDSVPAHTHAHGQVSPSSQPGFTRKIVAVGDLHGDLPNALSVLHMAGVVDVAGDWSGAVDYFVQTGDIIDRGDDTLKLYALMDKLRVQAQQVGGTVLTHLGNHEWMNVIGTCLFKLIDMSLTVNS